MHGQGTIGRLESISYPPQCRHEHQVRHKYYMCKGFGYMYACCAICAMYDITVKRSERETELHQLRSDKQMHR